jgi:hypothetical protein
MQSIREGSIMARETWVDRKSHYQAQGEVANGKMTGAEVVDNNGRTRDRNRTFESEQAFCAWARSDAGMS